jgi:hypothetical protein
MIRGITAHMNPGTRRVVLLLALLLPGTAVAEQSVSLGDLEVHWVLVPSTFLEPDIASRYEIERARNQGLVNLTVLSKAGLPRTADVTGTLINLLGQRIELDFRTLEDGDAIYYIAPFRYTDAELLRFEIDVQTPDSGGGTLKIRQKLYWE